LRERQKAKIAELQGQIEELTSKVHEGAGVARGGGGEEGAGERVFPAGAACLRCSTRISSTTQRLKPRVNPP